MPSVRTILATGLAMASAAATLENPHNPNMPKSPNNPSTASFISETMGPAAFIFPRDRVWDANMDNSPPCGSAARPGNRTKFPLKGGTARLVGQDEYYETMISISYLKDPKENRDFKLLMESRGLQNLNPGHLCVNLPDPDEKYVKNGTNATLQIAYLADWDTPGTNQTFYACADITYVLSNFTNADVGCFNVSEPGDDDRKAMGRGGSSDSSDSSTTSDSSGGSKLSGGGLAAAIVSPIVGGSMIAAGLFLYRRKQQQKRTLRLARMEENARREQWPMDKISSAPQKSV